MAFMFHLQAVIISQLLGPKKPHFQYQGFPLLELVIVGGSSLKASVDAVIQLRPSSHDLTWEPLRVASGDHAISEARSMERHQGFGQHMQPYWSLRWLVTFRTDHTMAGWKIPYNKWGFESENH